MRFTSPVSERKIRKYLWRRNKDHFSNLDGYDSPECNPLNQKASYWGTWLWNLKTSKTKKTL